MRQHTDDSWRKSSFSGPDSNCVEAARTLTAVRDSKQDDGPVLCVSRAAFAAMVSAVRDGDDR
jgi:Domain of unknown function (DUF397)